MEQTKQEAAPSHPPLITITGLKGSGKTAVVEAIVSELSHRGHKVGTIKTARHHPAPRDAKETDTRRHAEAGASVVVGLYADGTVCLEKGASPVSLRDLAHFFPANIDILISEGLLDPIQTEGVVLCLRQTSELDEAMRIRRLSAGSIVAISGSGAAAWEDPAVPAFDVTVPAQAKALVDLLLKRVKG